MLNLNGQPVRRFDHSGGRTMRWGLAPCRRNVLTGSLALRLRRLRRPRRRYCSKARRSCSSGEPGFREMGTWCSPARSRKRRHRRRRIRDRVAYRSREHRDDLCLAGGAAELHGLFPARTSGNMRSSFRARTTGSAFRCGRSKKARRVGIYFQPGISEFDRCVHPVRTRSPARQRHRHPEQIRLYCPSCTQEVRTAKHRSAHP